MESVLQRQPERKAVQRSFIRADGEGPGPSVQQYATKSIREGNLLQHHWLPQVKEQKASLHLLPLQNSKSVSQSVSQSSSTPALSKQ